jgi:signal transduction histidine kinase
MKAALTLLQGITRPRWLGRGFAAASLLLAVLFPAPAPAEAVRRNVLIISESDPSGGAPTIFSSTLRSSLDAAVPHVAVYGETVDLSRFPEARQQAILRTYVQEKYSGIDFGAIVAVGAAAYELVKHWRGELWPRAAVVFAAIDEVSAAEFVPDANTTGLIMRRTVASMVQAARAVVPGLTGVAVLGGTLEKDSYRRQYRQEIAALAKVIGVIDLTGRPLAEQASRAASLSDTIAILYTSLFIDDAGTRYSSPQALAVIAKSANRPIVIDVESLVGLGAVGGFVLNNVSYGREAAALVLRILDGTDAAAIPVTVSEFTQPVFDWRELSRWGISAAALPKGSEIRFRDTSVWERHKGPILGVVAAILLQSVLIAWLIYEHRRRSIAEIQSRNAMAELAAMNRLATAGQLSASIAHEINQPITGMVLKASAALRWLAVEKPDLDRVRNVLSDIVGAGQRAGGIINSVRAMFKNEESGKAAINLNHLVNTVLALLRVDLQKDDVRVETRLDEALPAVTGDAVQLQQVILNLIVNAADAMRAAPQRVLTIQTSRIAGNAHVSIEDTGPGIDDADRERIFNPLFTTKAGGMGMGLSICRSIIENHGGRIWVERVRSPGAIIQFALPAAEGRASSRDLAA